MLVTGLQNALVERQILADQLRAILTNGFYGQSSGYQHVEPDVIAEAIRVYKDVVGAAPTDKQWTCPGCGTQIPEGDNDIILGHVKDCDKVDGAGQRV